MIFISFFFLVGNIIVIFGIVGVGVGFVVIVINGLVDFDVGGCFVDFRRVNIVIGYSIVVVVGGVYEY